MHKKFGTVLDEKLLSRAKAYCHKKHKTISRFLHEAVEEYLQKEEARSPSFSAVEASFGSLKIPSRELRSVLEEDIYET
jgi:molybdopterin-guanine dinucleotide biosynthesis protein A